MARKPAGKAAKGKTSSVQAQPTAAASGEGKKLKKAARRGRPAPGGRKVRPAHRDPRERRGHRDAEARGARRALRGRRKPRVNQVYRDRRSRQPFLEGAITAGAWMAPAGSATARWGQARVAYRAGADPLPGHGGGPAIVAGLDPGGLPPLPHGCRHSAPRPAPRPPARLRQPGPPAGRAAPRGLPTARTQQRCDHGRHLQPSDPRGDPGGRGCAPSDPDRASTQPRRNSG